MGNSQGVQLRPTSPFSSGDDRGFGARKHPKERRRWSGGATKFASPENRVLPPPVAGQRLRTTDNGHILLNGGTISGRKLAMLAQQRERRNESFEDEDYGRDLNESSETPDTSTSNSQMLYGHKKSHSDPDIVHSMIRNDIGGDDDRNLSKSIIAVSPSKAKIKSRKKSRAPEPPLSNTLPRDLDRIPMFGHYRKSGRLKGKNDQIAPIKSKSPAPPPPPPPNGPNATDQQSAVYEKNKRGVTRWKISKSSSDLRNAEGTVESSYPTASPIEPALGRSDVHRKSYGDLESKSSQMTTIFESRNSYNAKLAEHIKSKTNDSSRKDKPNLNKSFQEEIMAAVKKKSGFSERNLCSLPAYKPAAPAQPHFQNIRSEQVKAAWTEELLRRGEDNNSEPDYENVEEPITYCLNEDRLNRQPVWKSESRPIEINISSKSPRFTRNDQARTSHVELRITRDVTQVRNEKSQKVEAFNTEITQRESHDKIKNGLTERDVKRHVEQQKHSKLLKTHENGQWIIKNTEEKLVSSPKREHQGLWTNNQYPIDVENRHSLAKEIYLQQEQQKRSRNLNQIENNLNSVDWPKHHAVERVSSEGSGSQYSSTSGSKDNYEIGALLRPTLPRKSLEIPQFSPTQAWKCLVVDQPPNCYLSDVSSDEGEVMEDKIRQFQKPVAPRRSTVERCTDSGISPDAGSPLPNHDRRDVPLHNQTRKPGVGRTASPTPPPLSNNNWIPQHDLMDDSDLGSVDQFQQVQPAKNHHFWADPRSTEGGQTKQSFPYGIFSGRQPTEVDGTYQLKILPTEKQKNRGKKKNKNGDASQHFNSLRSLKKVFGLKLKVAEEPKGLDTNWSLSRSTPVINKDTGVCLMEEVNLRHSPSEAMLKSNKTLERTDSRPRSDGNLEYLITADEQMEANVTPRIEQLKESKITKMKKKNKFAYQNTIRKEEKKKIEEKLNQEVIRREMQREKEIQWMNKVEEEFRKRRDREKINIRYQLKMLNDEDPSFEWDPSDIPAAERESRSLPYIPLHSPSTVNKINSSPPIKKQDKKESYNIVENASSTTASSPDLPQWPQSTGMSKWLRKKKSQKNSAHAKQNHLNTTMSSPRPEPEGGRSSGDEHRSLEANNDNQEHTNQLSPTIGKINISYPREVRNVLPNNKTKVHIFANGDGGLKTQQREETVRAFIEGHSVDSDCLESFIQSVDIQVKSNAVNGGNAVHSNMRHNAKPIETKKVPKGQFESVDYLRSDVMRGKNTKSPSKELTNSSHVNDDGAVFARGHPHRSGGRAKNAPLKLPTENPGYLPQPYSPNKVYRSIPFDLVLSSETHKDSSSSSRQLTVQGLRTAVEAR